MGRCASFLLAQALRYYLLRQVPATEDGDFTLERFARAYNRNLANDLGNLLHRVLSMVGRYYSGVAPAPDPSSGADEATDAPLVAMGRGLRQRVEAAVDRHAPHETLVAIWEVVDAANTSVEAASPWALAKRHRDGPEPEAATARLATVLYNLLEALRLIANACAPFLPGTAGVMAAQLNAPIATGAANGEGEPRERTLVWGGYPAGTELQLGGLLFPRIDDIDDSSEEDIAGKEHADVKPRSAWRKSGERPEQVWRARREDQDSR